MKIPTLEQTEAFLSEASAMNPGPWIDHSRYVAQAARNIAQKHSDLDPEAAYVLGCLHDIGRREGVHQLRHITDGYHFLQTQGFPDAACICLTHSFPLQDIREAFGKWDGSQEDYDFVVRYLAQITYNIYDRLFQLCDALALSTGFCILEKRFIDVVLRYGFGPLTLDKWRATLDIKARFEAEIGCPIYSLLPGIAENVLH